MNRLLCTLPLFLLLCACRDNEASRSADQPPAAGAPATSASTPSTAPDVPSAAVPAAVDTGAMSGAFGTGSTRLELHGEGTYGLDEGGNISSGTWTPLGADRIHLDPGTKSASDRIYRRDGNDALVLVEGEGEAAAGARLKRLPMP